MKSRTIGIALLAAGCATGAGAAERGAPAEYDAVIAKHARATGVPEALIRRVIVRESKYNPRAMHRGHYGMMQIKPATAKAMGYRGSAAGLLDADVNLTYGVRYLAGAWRVAGGDHDRAVRYYASGYYYDAKRKGMLAQIGMGRDGALSAPPAATAAVPVRVATLTQPAAAMAAPGAAPAVPMPVARGVAPAILAQQTAAAQPRGQAAAVQVATALPGGPVAPLPPVRPRDPRVAAPAAPVLASVAPTPRPRDLGPETTGSIMPAAMRAPAAPLPPVRAVAEAKPRVVAPAAPVLAGAGPLPSQARPSMVPTPPRR